MKKILFVLILSLISISAFSETQWYKTTDYAQATIRNGKYNWGNWQDSNLKISINLDTDVITIYSPRKQVYKVYDAYNNGNASLIKG